jgi:hypothetical protein
MASIVGIYSAGRTPAARSGLPGRDMESTGPPRLRVVAVVSTTSGKPSGQNRKRDCRATINRGQRVAIDSPKIDGTACSTAGQNTSSHGKQRRPDRRRCAANGELIIPVGSVAIEAPGAVLRHAPAEMDDELTSVHL